MEEEIDNDNEGLDNDDEPDQFDEDMDNCGMMPDGGCAYVGSEYCDWDCPFSSIDWGDSI